MDSNGFMGQNLFTDFNELPYQLERSMSGLGNTGNAVLQVAIEQPLRPMSPPYTTVSNATALMTTNTMTTIGANQLSLNGINIPVPTAANDLVSPALDAHASAIALANVINATTANSGVSAQANMNLVNLGIFTPNTLAAAGNFVINGTSIESNGTSASVIVEDINSQTYLTNVRAELDPNNNVLLIAPDGRNIQIDANGGGTGTFAYFNTTVVNTQVARASVTITGVGSSLVVGGSDPAAAGLTATTIPTVTTAMTDSDYSLSYNGNYYTLVRQVDNKKVYTGTSPNISVDGFTINLASGAMNANDSFTIRPTINACYNMLLEVPTVQQLAFACPLKVTNSIKNSGSAKLNLDEILNTSGIPGPTASTYGNAFYGANNLTPTMTPPIQIKFFGDANGKPTLYRIYDMTTGSPVQIGPEQQYNASTVNNIFPLSVLQDANNAPYTWDPGYRISLSGIPAIGDTFTVGLNDGKSNYSNANEFVSMQQEYIMNDNQLSYQDFYANVLSGIGLNMQQSNSSYKDAQTLYNISQNRLLSFSGVNMDDEAAKLMRSQQLFSASAQLLAAQKAIFSEIIAIFR
jgi:flagellar hook-associated protein FlgK